MTNESILVVEDEEKIARLLEIELGFEGYKVQKAYDGIAAYEEFEKGLWDLIILDVMLPRINGMELLRKIRDKNKTLPIILLTAKDSVEDKVIGLDLGANDYVTKPFQIEELLARIRTALRYRSNVLNDDTTDILTFSDLRMDLKSREIKRDGKEIDLTPREFDLLVYLLKNKGQVLNRQQILDAVWGYDFFGDQNVVDVYIRYVRKKIDKLGESSLISTVRGVGYVMKEVK